MNYAAALASSSKDRSFTKRHIKKKHLCYLKTWQRKLNLGHCQFILCAEPVTKKVPFAKVVRISKKNHLYLIALTPKTLADPIDWKDSVIHELLHVLFWELRKVQGRLTEREEESLVYYLAAAFVAR